MGLKKIIKRGDIADLITIQMYYEDPTLPPLDPSPSTPVVFNMRTLGGDVVIDRGSAAIISVLDGVVTTIYQWQAGDTDMVGTYLGEFEFAFSNGPGTLPEAGYLVIDIYDDIA